MQPLITKLEGLVGGRLAFSLGLLLISLLVLRLLFLLVSGLTRGLFASRQRKLALERMRLLVRAAELQCFRAEQNTQVWNGFRKFQVARKVAECADVCSFYLEPHDRKPLPAFAPGQYLTFQLPLPGAPKPEIRCYSLSDSAPVNGKKNYYRVTIKKYVRQDGKPGAVSHYFCDDVKEGDILDVKAPSGKFTLDLSREAPVVLISGGVGITPMLSMMNAILDAGSKREIWFFHGVRNKADHIQKDYLQEIASRHDNVRMHICYSAPKDEDKLGVDFQHKGRVSVTLMKELLPSSNYEYYMCGPPPFMEAIVSDLEGWGVPSDRIFYEAFGPATVKKVPKPAATASAATTAAAAFEVSFSRSNKSCTWDGSAENLLVLAEANGVKIDCGCRAGSCGTCLVAIKSGEVEYVAGHGAPAEERSCLTCIAKPKSSLVLDA